MAQAPGRSRLVADYLVGRQIGSGSFSVVWHARHRVHGTEVAIKEIAMGRLNKKLQDSLMSEIFILKRINHPNIIRLHDIIEVPGKIHLVLEYCKGGDLSMYIQRHGRIPEATAKHFMQQLAAGLQVLRDNNLIHRDLKPQNLLLSTNDDNSVLKIADFGFARSLQPRGLAETLCGSPLYMAPEIMQLQKYDAKADLWSVGAILFQFVTGRTPFTGNSQIQLLQNIVKSTELHFPPDSNNLSFECKDLCKKLLRRNPVERLTFEEFFNHPFLFHQRPEESRRMAVKTADKFPFSEYDPMTNLEENSQEECLPFFLDDDLSGPEGSPSILRRSSMKFTCGFNLDSKTDKGKEKYDRNQKDFTSRFGSHGDKLESTGIMFTTCTPFDRTQSPDKTLADPLRAFKTRSANSQSRVADSLELIDQDYVLVTGPMTEAASSSSSSSKRSHHPFKYGSPPQPSVGLITRSTAPMPIIGAATTSNSRMGSLESRSSAPETSQGSIDNGDSLERPSTHFMTRIQSLERCASTITELVKEKNLSQVRSLIISLWEHVATTSVDGSDWWRVLNDKNSSEVLPSDAGRQLEAFSIQLVILAIWKQALNICHTLAASAIEGSPSQETARFRRSINKQHSCTNREEFLHEVDSQVLEEISSQIESKFLREVEHAEELSRTVERGNAEMPDAMETIFQSALALGRHGGVEELLGKMESAAALYSKAVALLIFLLVEAPSLILNPPFSLTNSDRYRLRTYIDILNNRQSYSRSQHSVLSKCENQTSPP